MACQAPNPLRLCRSRPCSGAGAWGWHAARQVAHTPLTHIVGNTLRGAGIHTPPTHCHPHCREAKRRPLGYGAAGGGCPHTTPSTGRLALYSSRSDFAACIRLWPSPACAGGGGAAGSTRASAASLYCSRMALTARTRCCCTEPPPARGGGGAFPPETNPGGGVGPPRLESRRGSRVRRKRHMLCRRMPQRGAALGQRFQALGCTSVGRRLTGRNTHRQSVGRARSPAPPAPRHVARPAGWRLSPPDPAPPAASLPPPPTPPVVPRRHCREPRRSATIEAPSRWRTGYSPSTLAARPRRRRRRQSAV